MTNEITNYQTPSIRKTAEKYTEGGPNCGESMQPSLCHLSEQDNINELISELFIALNAGREQPRSIIFESCISN